MKYIRTLLAVLTGSLVFLSVVPQVTAGPDNTIYRVRVVSSFGTIFNDCLRFDSPNPGDLRIDGLGQILTYRHGQLDTLEERFKAVTRTSPALSIMFFGEVVDPLDLLTGEAVNEFGDSFVFTGPSDPSCVFSVFDSGQSQTSGSKRTTNPYSR